MKFVAALSLLMALVADGAQDTAYYHGFTNPNVENEMYYREAVNVLQGVEAGEFSALYIQYHSCVWSEYGHGEDEHDDGICGGVDGGDEFWYMGRTQCFRANVAYSVYGVKAGESSGGCSAKHYIDSYFTTGGIESFGDNTGVDYASYGASSYCTVTQEGGEQDGEGEDGGHRDHNELIYQDYLSAGLGCSAKGAFINAVFEGLTCSGDHFLSNNGEVEGLNEELNNLGCYQIYDASSGDYANAAALLTYSASCSHSEYPYTCPDPYGVKKSRDQKLIAYSQAQFKSRPVIMPIMATVLLVLSVVFYFSANRIRDSAKQRALGETTGEPSGLTTILEKLSHSFNRVATDVSARTQSFSEKLAQYAEEEDGEVENAGSYKAPEDEHASVARSADAASVGGKSEVANADDSVVDVDVANAMLSGMGVAPKPAVDDVAPSGRKYKRPRLAKVSRWIRGRLLRRGGAVTSSTAAFA